MNTLINKLPFELHLPGGYQFCGPGTHLAKRIARGDQGINPLDAACKIHDIAYAQNTNLDSRHKADAALEQKAWERFGSNDASAGEQRAAWLVTTAMKAKQKFGFGLGKVSSSKKKKITKRKKKGPGKIKRSKDLSKREWLSEVDW